MQRSVLIAIGGNSLLRAGELATVQSERAHVDRHRTGRRRHRPRRLARRAHARQRPAGGRGAPAIGVRATRGLSAAARRLRGLHAGRDRVPAAAGGDDGAGGARDWASGGHAAHAGGGRRQRPRVLASEQADRPLLRRPRPPTRAAQAGWSLVEVPGAASGAWCASPEPQQIVEQDAIRTLVDAGGVVIALGGGGIPVVRTGGELKGIEAVIDKDLASARARGTARRGCLRHRDRCRSHLPRLRPPGGARPGRRPHAGASPVRRCRACSRRAAWGRRWRPPFASSKGGGREAIVTSDRQPGRRARRARRHAHLPATRDAFGDLDLVGAAFTARHPRQPGDSHDRH